METTVVLSFMQKLYESLYGNGTITAQVRTADSALDIDTAFSFDHWEINGNKESITLYGEDDMRIVFNPQHLVKASLEDGVFTFNTDILEMVIGFV